MAGFSSRLRILPLLMAGVGLLLIWRLIEIQVMSSSKLAQEALEARCETVGLDPLRGRILDRKGVPLTNVVQTYSILLFPDQLPAGGIDPSQAAAIVTAAVGGNVALTPSATAQGQPLRMASGVGRETAERVAAMKIPGVLVVEDDLRYDPTGFAANVIGHINAADNQGVSGVEALFDFYLRGGGKNDRVAALVDAGRNLIRGLGYKRLVPDLGNSPADVVLTIDKNIQSVVEKAMDRRVAKGAVVVLDPATGEILAMASRPKYDANRLPQVLMQPGSPLLNRAVAAYQPGSVFKVVVAAAAIENGLASPEEKFFDPGYVDINGLRFRDWYYERGGRGWITFTEAMAQSTNSVFIQVARRIGAAELRRYAAQFGFGRPTSLGLDGEAEGTLPQAENMYPGDLANFAIGQGVLEATPLQVALMTATIANDGIRPIPQLVKEVRQRDGTLLRTFRSVPGVKVISGRTAAAVRKMMTAVTVSGTGQAAYVDSFGAAGKTGSAETGRTDSVGHSISHAWFTGYSPLKNPRFVATVFIEDGMSGADTAAPVFREIMTEILQK